MRQRQTRSKSLMKSKFSNQMDDPIDVDEDSNTGSAIIHRKKHGSLKRKCMSPSVLKIGETSTTMNLVDEKDERCVESTIESRKKYRNDILETDKGKKVVNLEKNKKKKDEVKKEDKFKLLGSRMSPSSMYHVVKSLSVEQRIMVKQMGFGAFLDIVVDTLPGKLSYYLVDRFRANKCAIKTKSGDITITKHTVKDMFGLPCEGVDFEDLNECEKTDPILTGWKQQYDGCKFNNGSYMEKIRQSSTADEMFKLNFLTLFINTFCETELMGSCKISFLDRLVKCEDVSKIDWCKYIMDCLVKTKYKWKPTSRSCKYVGPQTLLLLAYADKVECEDVKLRRVRSFIREVDGEHLRMLEKYEMGKGEFGSLKIREGEGLQEDIYSSMDILFRQILEEKSELEVEIEVGLERECKNPITPL